MIIELTNPSEIPEKIYLNSEHIIKIAPADKGSYILLTHDESAYVVEEPKWISRQINQHK